jgi:hypothetical protein
MEIGMLWVRGKKQEINEAARQAIAYYIEKYGPPPLILEVNYADVQQVMLPKELQVVVSAVHIPSQHFIIGRDL